MLSAARQIVVGGAVMNSLSKSIRTFSILILITAALAATSGCSLYMLQNLEIPDDGTTDPATGAEKVLCSTAEVTLAWDPPNPGITSYKIFYRSHESGSWILLDEIPADDDPEYILYHGDFGNGDYDFGVVAVDAETAESAMHTSLDDTAQPESGWYLSWEFCEID
jgi:hypothetical protein